MADAHQPREVLAVEAADADRPSRPARVLLVDDEANVRLFISSNLRASQYDVTLASDGGEAMAKFEEDRPDLILLDLGLPGCDGLEVIRRVRARSRVPIIVLTVRGAERDKIAALDRGADDYVTKPFAIGELLARVRAALRRAATVVPGEAESGRIISGDLAIDLEKRAVSVGGRPVKLTRTEYELLAYLATNAEKAVSHGDLLRQVWGPEYGHQNEYLHTFIAQLRRKIEPDPSRPCRIVTEPRFGYRFVPCAPGDTRHRGCPTPLSSDPPA